MTPASADDDRTMNAPAAGAAGGRRDAVVDALSSQGRRRGRDADPQSHTRAVNLAKVALPALAALILVVIGAWPLLTGPGAVRQAGPDAGGLEMVDARFVGTDPKSRPFEVRAEKVVQQGSGNAVDLVKPRAEITLPGGEWITLSAESGRFDRDSGKLSLAGQVTLYHDGGYEFMTERAELDTNEGVAWGDVAVRGQGPLGTIDAGGFRIMNDGDTVLFTGRSRLRLEDGMERGPG